MVRQPGDNSCLFHSLSFLLSYHDIVPSLHEQSSGFELRSTICSFIRDNPSSFIYLSSDLISSIEDALYLDNFSCLSYSEHMRNLRSWGGSLEIAIVAEMFSIGVSIFIPIKGKRSFLFLGSYKCISFSSDSHLICLLYTGNCHYDCLVDGELSSSSLPVEHSDYSSSNLSVQLRNYDMSVKRPSVSKKKVSLTSSSASLSSPMALHSSVACLPSSLSLRRLNRVLPSPLISQQSFVYANPVSVKGVVKSSSLSHRPKNLVIIRKLSSSEAKINRFNRRQKLAARRRNNILYREPLSKCSKDCASYSTNYDEQTQFIVCCICGIEGSREGYVLKDDVRALIDSSGLKDRFKSLTTVRSTCSSYDLLYIEQMLLYFDDGLIKGLSFACGLCVQQMRGRRVRSDGPSSVVVDGSLACEDNVGISLSVSEHVSSSASVDCLIPKFALFLGFFTGPVPVELVGLTPVEESMINIYSAVSKVTLARGGHYRVKSSSTYTIINDLTSVSNQLPRMPTLESIAVMRHKNTPIGKEYTYRPYRVYRALIWLKKFNHLYSNIDLVWGDDIRYWQVTETSIDIPFIEISDAEVSDIDNELNCEPSMSDEFSTNSG